MADNLINGTLLGKLQVEWNIECNLSTVYCTKQITSYPTRIKPAKKKFKALFRTIKVIATA